MIVIIILHSDLPVIPHVVITFPELAVFVIVSAQVIEIIGDLDPVSFRRCEKIMPGISCDLITLHSQYLIESSEADPGILGISDNSLVVDPLRSIRLFPVRCRVPCLFCVSQGRSVPVLSLVDPDSVRCMDQGIDFLLCKFL